MKKLLFLLCFTFSFVSAVSQETSGQDPVSWDLNLSTIEPITLPPLDLEQIRKEDSINDLDKSLPWRYGVTRPLRLDLEASGIWTTLEDGSRLWRVAIQSPEAINLSVNFKDFYLPPGARLQLYNGDRTDKSKSYSNENNRASKVLGSWFISGDIILIEYFEPSSTVGNV